MEFCNHPKRKVIYLIGNHDDPMYTGKLQNEDDYLTEEPGYSRLTRNATALRNIFYWKMRDIVPTVEPSFFVGRFYWNREMSLYAEHDHLFDKANWKEKGDRSSKGQEFVEKSLDEVKTNGPPDFQHMDSPPFSEIPKFLECQMKRLRAVPKPPDYEKVIKATKRIIHDGAYASAGWFVWLFSQGMDLILSDTDFVDFVKWFKLNNRIENEKKEYREHAKDLTKRTGAKVTVFGHTHVPEIKHMGDMIYANSGEWAYNIKCEPPCKLVKEYSNGDYFVKIARKPSPQKWVSVELGQYVSGSMGIYSIRIS
jgi:hypothetical protein